MTTGQLAVPQQKNPNTGDRGGWGHRFLEILKKEHKESPGVNTIQGVFMKNLWNFHWWSWFLLWNFHQKGVSHNFSEFAGVEACFPEVPKVTYLKISVFFRKVIQGIELRENFLTGHQFTNLLKSLIPLRHDFFGHFSRLDHQQMAFPHLKGYSWKNIKMKLTLL